MKILVRTSNAIDPRIIQFAQHLPPAAPSRKDIFVNTKYA